ncbi:hypothetical protein VNI00_009795 [Paramarasmius palmivorus]|uniref:Uncharacterized protein n=1 Tax=Paramarasmius palmivorus TaxID=297713 RepID=A0AAW0CMH1_9AGAR
MLKSHMAVATGFGQLFRGVGQVGGVAISSAIFQSKLDYELRKRIQVPDAEEVRFIHPGVALALTPIPRKLVKQIRQNARLVATLPPEIQRKARDSYAVSLKAVFIFAACSTLLAYLARLPIPEKDLDSRPRSTSIPPPPNRVEEVPPHALQPPTTAVQSTAPQPSSETPDSVTDVPDEEQDSDSDLNDVDFDAARQPIRIQRRVSTFESTEGGMDLESRRVGGSARSAPSV